MKYLSLTLEMLQGYDNYFDEDGTPLEFCTQKLTIEYDEMTLYLNKLPYLINFLTGSIFFTTPAVRIIEEYLAEAKKKGKSSIFISQFNKFNRGKLPISKNTKYKYSAAEHFFIPGLIREFPSDGYLTPVYFGKNVLVKYKHVTGYENKSISDSFGIITIPGYGAIRYGINKSENVIMWLGDIVNLDERELLYLYSENIDPQYDLHSDFYENQILNRWI